MRASDTCGLANTLRFMLSYHVMLVWNMLIKSVLSVYAQMINWCIVWTQLLPAMRIYSKLNIYGQRFEITIALYLTEDKCAYFV